MFGPPSSTIISLTSLLLVLCWISGNDCLSGFLFEDNKSDKRYVPENGEINYKIPTYPHQVRCRHFKLNWYFIKFFLSIVPALFSMWISTDIPVLYPSGTSGRKLCFNFGTFSLGEIWSWKSIVWCFRHDFEPGYYNEFLFGKPDMLRYILR